MEMWWKWRCGGNEDNSDNKKIVGKGPTNLLNNEGYMCCLGQFSLQLNKELSGRDIHNKTHPSYIKESIPYLTNSHGYNSSLSNASIKINDNPYSTPKEKIAQLKKLFAKNDLEIEVINMP